MKHQPVPWDRLVEDAVGRFRQHYAQAPVWIVAAPGRVNVIGEHTDYNEGYVLPMAIERYTVLAAAPRPRSSTGSPTSPWHSASLDETVELPLTHPIRPGDPHWANYPRGVIAGFLERGATFEPFQVLAVSNVPLGGGLSSSAALEVATATLLEIISGQQLDPVEKALLCQKAEHDYAGVPCGIMDQFTAVMGKTDHLLLLDCRSRETQLVPLTDPDVTVLIFNTNVRHELAGGEYARRRAQCEAAARELGVRSLRDASAEGLAGAKDRLDPVVYRRAKHVLSENERTWVAAEGIRESNWPTVGQLMYASHFSLQEDYEVSCPELDAVVEIAQDLGPEHGVIGCRMTGGGFGGCAVSLVRTEAVAEVSGRLSAEYQARTRIQPSLFVSRPASGATVVRK